VSFLTAAVLGQLAVGAVVGPEADLAVLGVQLVQPLERDAVDVADPVVAEVAEQGRHEAGRRGRHVRVGVDRLAEQRVGPGPA
jgi:hypothetical protein